VISRPCSCGNVVCNSRICYDKIPASKDECLVWLSDDELYEKSKTMGGCAALFRKGIGEAWLFSVAYWWCEAILGAGVASCIWTECSRYYWWYYRSSGAC